RSTPDRLAAGLSLNAHHRGFWPKQLQVVWDLVLQPDPEGPTLISHAAWRSESGPVPDPSHLRGAQSSAYRVSRYPRRRISRSNGVNRTLLSRGETIRPWGVPCSVGSR